MTKKTKDPWEELLEKSTAYFDESVNDLRKTFWSKPATWVSILSLIVGIIGVSWGIKQDNKVSKLEVIKDSLQMKVTSLKTMEAIYQRDIEKKANDLKELNKEFSEIYDSIKLLTQQLDNLSKENSKLLSSNTSLGKDNDSLSHYFWNRKIVLNDLRYELDSINEELESIKKEIKFAEDEQELLKKANDDLLTRNNKLIAKFNVTETKELIELITPKLRVYDRVGFHPNAPNKYVFYLVYPSKYEGELIEKIESVYYILDGINLIDNEDNTLKPTSSVSKNGLHWYTSYNGNTNPEGTVAVLKVKNDDNIYEIPFPE